MSGAADAPSGLILMYHHICDSLSDPFSLSVSPRNFAAHLEVLQDFARPLPLRQLNRSILDRQIEPRSVVITFDDGYASNLLAARPLLQQHQTPATIFVTTGFLGSKRELWWDQLSRILLEPGTLPGELSLTIQGNSHSWELGQARIYTAADAQRYRQWQAHQEPPTGRHTLYISLRRLLQLLPEEQRLQILDEMRAWADLSHNPREDYRGLSHAELAELATGGLVEIGAHTVTHPALPELSFEQQRLEIAGGKERLEAELQSAVVSFAYPFGASNANSADLVRQSGFECACATMAGLVDCDTDRFQLPRMQVRNWNKDEFHQHVQRWMEGTITSPVWTSFANGDRSLLVRGKWDLRVAGGNVAYLQFPDGGADHARIQIDSLVTQTSYDIQLNLPRLAVSSGCAYEMVFQARADAPRRLAVGVAQAHEPWAGLGLYDVVEISSEWRAFQLTLVSTANEEDARIHFDAGGDSISVEVSGVVLHQQTQ